MWTVKKNDKLGYYLTFDRTRRKKSGERGIWEFIGNQGSLEIHKIIEINSQNGLLCLKDDEGGVRVFVLGD